MKKEQNKAIDHPEHVRAQIAERAYYIAMSQGFPDGRDEEHWLIAEAEVLSLGTESAGKKDRKTAAVAAVNAPALSKKKPVGKKN